MSKTERDKFRKALLSLQQRLRGDAANLAEEAMGRNQDIVGGGAPGTGDAADVGLDIASMEQTLTLLRNEEQVLEEIADALQRMDVGTYGQCEECERAIPKTRLRALPYARYCVPCAELAEQHP